jgi:hypothetical protein
VSGATENAATENAATENAATENAATENAAGSREKWKHGRAIVDAEVFS